MWFSRSILISRFILHVNYTTATAPSTSQNYKTKSSVTFFVTSRKMPELTKAKLLDFFTAFSNSLINL